MILLYDKAGTPLDLQEWSILKEDPSYYRVAETVIRQGDSFVARVSTVWIGARMKPEDPPLIFETGVFGSLDVDLVQGRYASETAARVGHEQVVADLAARLAKQMDSPVVTQVVETPPKQVVESREWKQLMACGAQLTEEVGLAAEEWARDALLAAAGHCTDMARVFELDPTLATEPSGSNHGLVRSVDLVAELGRQIKAAVRRTRQDALIYTAQHRADDRDWALAAVERAGQIVRAAVLVLPRPTDTVEGRRDVSRLRLAGNHQMITKAAETVAAAVRTSHQLADAPDRRAAELDYLVGRLKLVGAELAREHELEMNRINGALGFDQAREGGNQ